MRLLHFSDHSFEVFEFLALNSPWWNRFHRCLEGAASALPEGRYQHTDVGNPSVHSTGLT
jgi:hypothetical protein